MTLFRAQYDAFAGTTRIDLLRSHHVDQFGDPHIAAKICDVDETSDPIYTGYESPDGNWLIMKKNIANNTTRYAVGSSGYLSAWNSRASLGYDLPSRVFTAI